MIEHGNPFLSYEIEYEREFFLLTIHRYRADSEKRLPLPHYETRANLVVISSKKKKNNNNNSSELAFPLVSLER